VVRQSKNISRHKYADRRYAAVMPRPPCAKAAVDSDEIGIILIALSVKWTNQNAHGVGPQDIIQRSGFNVVHR
jgi:hypothetical protein